MVARENFIRSKNSGNSGFGYGKASPPADPVSLAQRRIAGFSLSAHLLRRGSGRTARKLNSRRGSGKRGCSFLTANLRPKAREH